MPTNKDSMEIPVIKNLFKDNQKKFEQNTLSTEELEAAMDEIYKEEDKDATHSQEIANYRMPIRIEKGTKVVKEELSSEWQEFVTKYSSKEIPYNYALETILKYLIMLDEGIYRPFKIGNMFIDETKGLPAIERTFILTNIDKYAKMSGSFYQLVKVIFEKQQIKEQSSDTQTLIKELTNMGVPAHEAEILSTAKIVKLIENGHEIAELMAFESGNKEGVDNYGNWVFIEEVTTKDNRHFQIIFKTNKDDQMRYIIERGTNIALVTNKDGSYKAKINMQIDFESCPNNEVKTLIEKIDNIITEISLIDVTHDEAYDTTCEIIELISPVSDNDLTLKVAEIYDQEIQQLKKAHE
ncbi:MAG: hypothetical protein OSJ70_10160 [Bacilli bacterium]|mgnify:CR=1 FL=1|nr:hypothetical protein [Bacilli bacterium]